MKRHILLAAFLIAALVGAAQDSNYVRRIICDLSSAEMYGRGMQHRGDSIAAEYLRAEMTEIGMLPLSPGYRQHFRFPQTRTTPPVVQAGYRSQNLAGYLPGEVDTMVVFSAHYDHLGMHADTLFPGAHDNASGVAALLDIARHLSSEQRHYTYVFLFFGGEEAGLIGSTRFAESPLINLARVKLLVNIDLFCGGEDGLMVVNANDPRTSPMVDLLSSLAESWNYSPTVGRRNNAPNSDHWPLSAHCPAIFIYTMGGPYGGYHNPDDTCEGCGLEYYSNFHRLLYIFLQHIAAQ